MLRTEKIETPNIDRLASEGMHFAQNHPDTVVFTFFNSMLCCLQWSKAESSSTVCFYELLEAGRTVYSMNLTCRFIQGNAARAPDEPDFDDSCWEVISVPHDLDIYV